MRVLIYTNLQRKRKKNLFNDIKKNTSVLDHFKNLIILKNILRKKVPLLQIISGIDS